MLFTHPPPPRSEGFVLRSGHTSSFQATELVQARQLLDVVFEGDMTGSDWEHALGGMHVMAWHGASLVGHASLIQRRLLYRGTALRTGYVEAVGVHPNHQRRGLAGRMMDILEQVICKAYDLGALGATDSGAKLYARRGWLRWQGRASALTPHGIVPTPDDADCLYVLPVTLELDVHAELTCDWRDGDVW
jgi:aminoglycoside 2'-N-acetyltransferase I